MTGAAPIQCRWVECNKGDDENPDIRSRAVVCETIRVSNIAPGDVNSVFPATPPLEAIRAQCSLMMSRRSVGGEPIVMQFLDTSKSHRYSGRISMCDFLRIWLISQNVRIADDVLIRDARCTQGIRVSIA